MEWLYPVVAILGISSSIVAWLVKLRWSQEFKEAKESQLQSKEEIIKIKEAQLKSLEDSSKGQLQGKEEILKAKDAEISALNREIESLKELSSIKVREHFLSVKHTLEESITTLERELKEAKIKSEEAENSLQDKEIQIEKLLPESEINKSKIEELEIDRTKFKGEINKLRQNLEEKEKSLEQGSKIEKTLEQAEQAEQAAAKSEKKNDS